MDNENQKANAGKKNILSPEEQLRQFAKGKMELQLPIQDGSNTIRELRWDFLALTGAEYCDAMDRDSRAVNSFRITYVQALSLFAVAAAKATGGLDSTDIRQRMGLADAQLATQITTVFFRASWVEGSKRISEA